MSVLSENLKLLRLKSGLKQVEFAEKLKISASNLSNYEIGKVEPDIDTLVKIATFYEVPIDSLVKSDLSVIAKNLTDGNLIREKEAAKNAKKGNLKGNIMGNLMVNEPDLQPFSRMPKVVTVAEDGNDNVVLVPLRARAGYLAGYEDPEFIQTLPTFRLPGFNVGTFRAFEIYGHSMVPTFQESDIIMSRFVENFNEIRDDRVYIIVSKREGVVAKRVINRVKIEGKLILNSDNQRHPGEYPPLIVDPEDILEIWYAVAFFSRQMRSPREVYNRLNDMEARLTFIEASQKKQVK